MNGPINRDVLNLIISVGNMEAMANKSDGEKKLKGGRLLCLDGGGIRGLILVQMLLELETMFEVPIQQCFDWIAGTSTGGIIALGNYSFLYHLMGPSLQLLHVQRWFCRFFIDMPI